MKLYYYKAPEGNFGDDLNPWLWPKLLPGVFDNDDRILFVGIGTLLNDRIPDAPVKVVFGSGVGYPDRIPHLNGRWQIRALRGPMTARVLGVSLKFAITDPAVLVRLMPLPKVEKTHRISYMPHFRSATVGQWKEICGRAGLNYIDPRAGVEACLREVASSEILVAEAMHGAIVADALRVPWLVVRANSHHNEGKMDVFKWNDWRASLNLPFHYYRLPPLWGRHPHEGMLQRLRRRVKEEYAVSSLRWLMRRGRPCLSKEQILNSAIAQFEEKLEALKKEAASLQI